MNEANTGGAAGGSSPELDDIKIERSELFAPAVDEALRRNRQREGRPLGEVRDPRLFRRLLHNSFFYLPAAAVLAAVICHLIIEPQFDDMARKAGDIVLVNHEPFDLVPGMTSITVEDVEVVISSLTEIEPGPDGEPPLVDPAIGQTVEAVGVFEAGKLFAVAIRSVSPEHAAEVRPSTGASERVGVLMFLLAAAMIALLLLVAEGISSRNWSRMVSRALIGLLLSVIFALVAMIPGGLILAGASAFAAPDDLEIWTVHSYPAVPLVVFIAGRSIAWACIGTAIGLGMNLVRSTRAQLRNSVVGGAMGGALGGLFFDPIDRFIGGASAFDQASVSRLTGFIAVGLSIGLFVALVDRLSREGWLRVRTGPLAGKSFVFYKTPTTIGSSPDADIYLFKDAQVDEAHASVHRVGNTYEIEDLGSRAGSEVGGQKIRRRRLVSGDQITLGGTVLEFEERQSRRVKG
jgi:hypothetical protein